MEAIVMDFSPEGGKIEVTVKGVSGPACQKLTEDYEKTLGAKVSTKPTQEMYEQKQANQAKLQG